MASGSSIISRLQTDLSCQWRTDHCAQFRIPYQRGPQVATQCRSSEILWTIRESFSAWTDFDFYNLDGVQSVKKIMPRPALRWVWEGRHDPNKRTRNFSSYFKLFRTRLFQVPDHLVKRILPIAHCHFDRSITSLLIRIAYLIQGNSSDSTSTSGDWLNSSIVNSIGRDFRSHAVTWRQTVTHY